MTWKAAGLIPSLTVKYSQGSGRRATLAEPGNSEGHEFHPEAEIDLDAIWEFIAEDNHVAADRMVDAIKSTIKGLVVCVVNFQW
jgi:hypothetical protein